MGPSVSICIPVHDPDFINLLNLQYLLESVISQELAPLEVVLTSNHAVPYIKELLNDLKPPFKVRHEIMPTTGAVDNFNNAFQLSQGEIVKFICQDDFLLRSDSLHLIVQELSHSDRSWLVHGTTHFIDAIGAFDRSIKPVLRGDLRQGVNRIGGPSSTAFYRSAYRKMNPLFHFAYDCDWYLRMAHSFGRPRIVSRSLAGVRIHRRQSTHQEEWRLEKEVSYMMEMHEAKKLKRFRECTCQSMELES